MTSIMTLPSHMSGFLHELGPSSGVYSYVSYPSAILPTNRAKYRNEIQVSSSSNIMQNKRVVRGNTYAQRVPFKNFTVQSTLEEHGRLPNIGKTTQLTSAASWQNTLGSGYRPKTAGGYNMEETPGVSLISPSARRTASRARARKRLSSRLGENECFSSCGLRMNGLCGEGRKSTTAQTETWLEEIRGRVTESHIGVQTDSPIHFLQPPTPRQVYQPPEGVDKSTQILPDDPDLFVFNEEVIVVLEALVGKTLEQSMMEVIEEEELAAITKQKLTFWNKSLVMQHSC